jgi:hypothetical protein
VHAAIYVDDDMGHLLGEHLGLGDDPDLGLRRHVANRRERVVVGPKESIVFSFPQPVSLCLAREGLQSKARRVPVIQFSLSTVTLGAEDQQLTVLALARGSPGGNRHNAQERRGDPASRPPRQDHSR